MTTTSLTETATAARSDLTDPSATPRRRVGALVAIAVAIVLAAVILLVPLPREVVGLLTIALVIDLLLAGVYIGIAMLVAGAVGLISLGGFRMIDGTFEQLVFNSVASWQLSVIPMFILMGIIMWKGGLTAGAYEAARQWLGRLPGGLALASNFAGAGLAATSGSSIGISYALGRIAIPEMLRAGYKPSFATGTVAAVGTLGQLIPPSVMLVIYAGIAQTAVGPQLVAAVIPGLVLALLFGVLIVGSSAARPSIAPRADLSDVTWATRFRSISKMIPIAAVILVVIGGIFLGIFTPTEAGAFGALAAFVVSWIAGGKGNRDVRRWAKFIFDCVMQTILGTAGIFLLIMGVTVLTRMVTLSRLSQQLSETVADLGLDRITLLLVLIVVYYILGMFLDPLAMMLLTIPVLTPALLAVGVDMIWYGVFTVLLAEVAILSPPIGMLAFIVHKLSQSKDVNLGQRITLPNVFAGVMPYIVVAVLFVVVLILLPDLALWLPGISSAQ